MSLSNTNKLPLLVSKLVSCIESEIFVQNKCFRSLWLSGFWELGDVFAKKKLRILAFRIVFFKILVRFRKYSVFLEKKNQVPTPSLNRSSKNIYTKIFLTCSPHQLQKQTLYHIININSVSSIIKQQTRKEKLDILM